MLYTRCLLVVIVRLSAPLAVAACSGKDLEKKALSLTAALTPSLWL